MNKDHKLIRYLKIIKKLEEMLESRKFIVFEDRYKRIIKKYEFEIQKIDFRLGI